MRRKKQRPILSLICLIALLLVNTHSTMGEDMDYGDCPEPYPTLLVDNGARHGIGDPNLYLGNSVDLELDGQPTPDANGDDVNGVPDDEDGVFFLTDIRQGETAEVNVIASKQGLLDAWLDFNADGDFNDPGEQIFTSFPLNTGSNILTFNVPANLSGDGPTLETYARFRFSSTGGLDPDGPADDGEVEDYMVWIDCLPRPPDFIIYPDSDSDGKYTVCWEASAGATYYQLESSAPASGTTIYPLWVQVYSGTAPTYAEKVGGGTWSYRVKATNACGSSDWTYGSNSCVVSDCLKSTAKEYAAWVKWRYPACWCFPRQCRGDANGQKLGQYWVQLADLTILKAAWALHDAWLKDVPNGICANFNHSKLGLYRVSLSALTILKQYWLLTEANVPCCDNDSDCILQPSDNYNFWTN